MWLAYILCSFFLIFTQFFSPAACNIKNAVFGDPPQKTKRYFSPQSFAGWAESQSWSGPTAISQCETELDHSSCGQRSSPCLLVLPPAAGIPAEVHQSKFQKDDISVNTAALRCNVNPFSKVSILKCPSGFAVGLGWTSQTGPIQRPIDFT